MKKILTLLLSVCLLLGAASILSACASKNGEVSVKGKPIDIDLTGYTVIYPDAPKDGSISRTFQTSVADFAKALSNATGLNIRAFAQGKSKNTAADPEILVGLTSRAESQDALAMIKGHGFVINVTDNKIAIVGTTNLLTLKALDYFTRTYLNTDTPGETISVHQTAKAQKMEMVTLGDPNGVYYSLVYDADLDTDKASEYGSRDDRSFCDYPYDAAVSFKTELAKLTGIKEKGITVIDDKAEAAERELVVGITQREVSSLALSALAADEYALFIKNGQIAVAAWNNVALTLAAESFVDYMRESQVTDENGTVSILMPADFELRGNANANWRVDFPKPEGLQLHSTVDVGDNSLEYTYMGEGINAATFSEYCKTLVANGYTRVSENEIEESQFAIYKNEDEGISLYVTYNAYKYAADSEYAYAEPTLRVVSSPLDSVTLPCDELLSPQSYNKVTDSAITAIELPAKSSGTGYVISLEDGRFVVLDGGAVSTGEEVDNFWNLISDLNQKHSGQPTSAQNPVRVAAWFISHSHGDHYGLFEMISKKHGKNDLVLEYLIGNFPSASQIYNTPESSTTMSDYMDTYKSAYKSPFTYIKVHTGQKLYFANVEMEILFTHEELNPHNIVTMNDSSTLARFNFDVTGGEEVSFLFTGDAYRYSGRWAVAMFGDYLRSDMVSVSHHGGPGLEGDFYTYVMPETVWFPNVAAAAQSYLKQSTWYGLADKQLYDLSTVKYMYCASGGNTTLYLRENGPDHDNLYGAGNGEMLEHDNLHRIAK